MTFEGELLTCELKTAPGQFPAVIFLCKPNDLLPEQKFIVDSSMCEFFVDWTTKATIGGVVDWLASIFMTTGHERIACQMEYQSLPHVAAGVLSRARFKVM